MRMLEMYIATAVVVAMWCIWLIYYKLKNRKEVKIMMDINKAKEIRESKGLVDTNLARIRVTKGLSQAKLSEKSGVTIRTIRSYESRTRHTKKASYETLELLAKALECDIAELIDD